MTSGCNNFNYFSKNQLTKLAHSVQFKSVLISRLGIGRLGHWTSLWYAKNQKSLQDNSECATSWHVKVLCSLLCNKLK